VAGVNCLTHIVSPPAGSEPTTLIGVIQIEATNVPEGLWTPLDLNEDRFKFTGELRVFKERTPTGLVFDSPRVYPTSFPRSLVQFGSLQEAEAIMENHRERTCSWLHNHTVLPEVVTRQVGEFLCPPPVFFFEEGDLCLGMDWSRGNCEDQMCRSCIIARRRLQD